MRKHWLTLIGVIALMIVIWGCSKDNPTSPVLTDSAAMAEKGEMIDVLVGFQMGNRPDAAIANASGYIKQEYKHIPVAVVTIPTSARKALENNPNVAFVEDNMWRDYTAQVLDWGVDRIDAEYVWTNSSYDGSGVNVGVLDSGGDMDHPDLTWAGGYSATDSDTSYWEDKVGHGTHVAGIISANNNTIGVVGVAPNCDIYAVQVGGRRLSVIDIIEGIDWTIATHYDSDPNNDIQVINMSFEGLPSTAEETAVYAAYGEGIILVAATGNSSSVVSAPALYDCVIAVTASTQTDIMASFSDYGPEVELIAPGYQILSTYKKGNYATMSGTSMACPMVVGVAALAWQANPTYTNVQIRNLLDNTAEDIGLPAYQQGNGLVDAENATLGTTNGDD